MKTDLTPRRETGRLALLLAGLLLAAAAPATTITIVNDDDPGVGFNDSTPADPVDGNSGTTLGEQRMNTAQAAADQWAGLVESQVEILVQANWEELECSPDSGVLGFAGPVTLSQDFQNAPENGVWYHIALARSLAGPGSPIDTGEPDVTMTLNLSLDDGDSGCLQGNTWHYGLENSGPAGTVDLLPVILHELAHGLGFTNFVDLETGSLFQGDPDVYMSSLRDTQADQDWLDMNDAQRADSATNDPNVVWTGPAATEAAEEAVTAQEAFSDGFLRVHAPGELAPGSSISHFTADASPPLLMRPSLGNLDLTQVDITPALFEDLGWTINDAGDEIFRDRFEGIQ